MEPHAVFSFTGGPILGPAPQTFLPPPQDHPTIILGVDEIILGVDGIIPGVDDFGYHLEIILVALKAYIRRSCAPPQRTVSFCQRRLL